MPRVGGGQRRLAVPVATIALAGVAVAAAIAGYTTAGGTRDNGDGVTAAAPSRSRTPVPTPPPTVTRTPVATPTGPYEPARYADAVTAQTRRAGINPRLLMAILYNEAYKPHEPAVERAWQRIRPDAAFGIANMHEATFNEVKRGRDFATRDWRELPDDPVLAIEAAAWYLHDLAGDLPAQWPAPYTRDELLALGYNAGPGSMLAFARGATPGEVSRSYLDRLRANWAKAGAALG